MSLSISKRLQKIIDMCDPCDYIVDVGTDHGKVAISIANKNISHSVIAIDNKVGPLNACMLNAKKYLNVNSAKFTTLLSDGLEKLDKSFKCGIIITGIGYDAMKTIIANVNEYNYKYLILSPHTKITELIKYLDSMDIDVIEESGVYDHDKYYYIIKGIKRSKT